MDPVRASYDAVAARYRDEVGTELEGKPLDRALLGAVAEMAGGGVMADLGCGPGHVAGYLRAGGATVVGLDLSPTMCTLARREQGVAAAAGDLRQLPVAAASLYALVCLYAVIHLDESGRWAAYSEFARVLRPGAPALVAFHVRDADAQPGGAKTRTEWWGHAVDLTFRFLDPARESAAMVKAGLEVVARLDRRPIEGVEHPSERSYILARRPEANS